MVLEAISDLLDASALSRSTMFFSNLSRLLPYTFKNHKLSYPKSLETSMIVLEDPRAIPVIKVSIKSMPNKSYTTVLDKMIKI